MFFFFQAEDGIRDAQESRGLGDVYKRQLQQIGSFTGVDRTYLHLFSPDGRTVAEQYEWWLSGEVEVVGQPMDNLHYYQWSMAKLRRLEIVQVPEVEKLPGEAAPERSLWMEMGERSVLALSLIHISEPTRLLSISYAVFCLKKKKTYQMK